MFGRDTIPGFGSAEMEIVDTVQVHVLSVPGECSLPHTKIKIRSVHTLDRNAQIFIHAIQNRTCKTILDASTSSESTAESIDWINVNVRSKHWTTDNDRSSPTSTMDLHQSATIRKANGYHPVIGALDSTHT